MTIRPTPRFVGYATVASMLPYLSLKVAWLAGSDIGVEGPNVMRDDTFLTANAITAGMELTAAALVLALVHQWGRRLPAWLLLFPMWAASGLLAPVMLAAPVAGLVQAIGGSTVTASATDGSAPVSDLQPWVYGLVYTGFAVQGAGLALAFALYLRGRWGTVLGTRLSHDESGATHGAQVLATAAVGGLTAVVVVLHLYWALGGVAGLPSGLREGRQATQQVTEATWVLLALVGALGLGALVGRRPRGARLWLPLAATWVGAGAMFWWGAYQLITLLAPGSPFETSGDVGGYALGLMVQTAAGMLAAVTGMFHLAEIFHHSPSPSPPLAPRSCLPSI
ncbi:hypothetical protein [Plantactinospora sp. GCM10030261]|uniref:hypothetical protein n=1 Tax=Plantactinospora sp. GCM10030261 TaxID=3273420 RepID=UPI00360AC25E